MHVVVCLFFHENILTQKYRGFIYSWGKPPFPVLIPQYSLSINFNPEILWSFGRPAGPGFILTMHKGQRTAITMHHACAVLWWCGYIQKIWGRVLLSALVQNTRAVAMRPGPSTQVSKNYYLSYCGLQRNYTHSLIAHNTYVYVQA